MSSDRKNKFILGTSSGYVSSVLSIIIAIFAVPIGVKYFGVVKYGAFAIINTLIAYMTLTSFGIPGSVAILTAKALDRLERLKIIAKGFVMITLIVGLAGILLSYLSGNTSWIRVLGDIPLDIQGEVSRAAFLAAFLFLLNVPFSLFLQGFIGIQKLHVANIYNMVLAVFTFLALIITVQSSGTLVMYFVLRGTAAVLISFLSAIHFLFLEKENRGVLTRGFSKVFHPPQLNEFSSRSIFTTGYRLFMSGIAAMVVWNTDNLVLSHFMGIESVTPYAITFRLITVAFIIFTTMNAALAPIYGNAYASGDHNWVNKTYNNITTIAQMLGGLVWIGSIAFAEDIINVWVGPSGYGGMLMVFAMGGYGYSVSLVHAHSGLYGATNLLKNSIRIAWSEAIANIVFSILLVRYLGGGGVALGTFLAAIFTVFWMTPLEIRRRTAGRIKFNYQSMIKRLIFHIVPCLIAVLLTGYMIEGRLIRIAINVFILGLYLSFSYNSLNLEMRTLVSDTALNIVRKLKRSDSLAS